MSRKGNHTSSSDYESVRLSGSEDEELEDRQFFRQIEVRDGRSEIKEYRSCGERLSTFFMNCMSCSFFSDDNFDYESVELGPESMIDEQNEHHLKLLEMEEIIPEKSFKRKRHSNNSKPKDDDDDELLLPYIPPPADSAIESSSEESDESDNNIIIPLPVPVIKPKTPPVSSSSSSSSSDETPASSSITHINMDSKENDIEKDENEHLICASSIDLSVVPRIITFINTKKQVMDNLKITLVKEKNRVILINKNDTDRIKEKEDKIMKVLDIITWCSKLMENFSLFEKQLNNKNMDKKKVFITYDLSKYCSEIRSFFDNKLYSKYMNQEEGYEDLPMIQALPQIHEIQNSHQKK